MMEYYPYIVIFILSLIFSAFFSASEVAFFSITRAKVRALVNEKVAGADVFAELKKDPEQFLMTVLIGNLIVTILAATVATALAVTYFKTTAPAVITSTVIVSLLFLFFGEIGPKMYAGVHATSLALAVSPVIHFLSRVFGPVIWICNRMSYAITGRSSLIDRKRRSTPHR